MSDTAISVEEKTPVSENGHIVLVPKSINKKEKEIVSDTAKRDEQGSDDRHITSLTFEQVNDNADELIELRGEGRYFGVTDPLDGTTVNALQSLGPLCANCHKRGHIRAKCKTVVCHKCGVVGQHYETQCPTTMVCSRCGQKGHVTATCTNKAKKRAYCKHCDTFSHGDDMCPSIWRSYLTLPTPKSDDDESTVLPAIACYNCASDEHYGDECPEPRSSRIPNISGSAFSGTNLPKHLRELYFDRLNGETSKKGKKSKKKESRDKEVRNDLYNGYGNNGYNNSGYGNSGYNNSGYSNSGYSNNGNYQNGQYNNYNNNTYNNKPLNRSNNSRDFYGVTYNNFNNSRDYHSLAPQPSRSGYLNTNKSKKNSDNGKEPTRSGFIAPKGNKVSKNNTQRPSRSGMIEGRSKKQKNKNIKHLY